MFLNPTTKTKVIIKGLGARLVDPYKKVFDEDRFVVILVNGCFTGAKILNNNTIDIKHNYFYHTMGQMQNRYAKISQYNYQCIGYFNSVFESKLYIREGRIKFLEENLACVPEHITEGNSTYSSKTPEYDAIMKNSESIIKGELAKLYKWRSKYSKKYPEYFI